MTGTTDLPRNLPEVAGRKWIRACGVDQLPEDEGLPLATIPATAVFAAEGAFFCIDDTCTHDKFSLAEGWLEGCVVECTAHMAKFDLRTGKNLTPPATEPVAVHPVSRAGDDLYVALPSSYLVKEN